LGEPGSGKSLLLEVFAREMRRCGATVARVAAFGLQPAECLWSVASSLGLNPPQASGLPILWRMLSDRLAEHHYQQISTVLLFDDADSAGRETLAHIARLAKHEHSPDCRMAIVLAGRPNRMGRLGADLLDLAELRIDLEAWEQDETHKYLTAAMARAGCRRAVFAEPAVARLHELAQGVPRRINQLAELALLAGAGQGLDQIDAETVESVCRELGAIEA
jgi:general secretion pathway protein A